MRITLSRSAGAAGAVRPPRIFFSSLFANFVSEKEEKKGLGRGSKKLAIAMKAGCVAWFFSTTVCVPSRLRVFVATQG